jgi:hypothetical protein
MPNTTAPAAATGLPEDTDGPLTRRTVLAALAGTTIAAVASAVAAAAPADPVLDLIAKHAEAAAIFNAIPDDDETADAAYLTTWTALADAPAATTRQGAAAALNVILTDGSHIDPVHAGLIRSALAFLHSGAGRVA